LRLTGSWEKTVSGQLGSMRLASIRSKMLVFAVVATLVPSVSTTWVFYVQNRHAQSDKIGEQLATLSSEATRELDLWLKERDLDLKVFASSDEAANVTRASTSRAALARATGYLTSVRQKYTDYYEELMVIGMDGHVVATSGGTAGTVDLPRDWQKEIRAGTSILSDATWDSTRGKAVMLAAVPIHLASGQTLGALTARVNLATVDSVLKRYEPPVGRSYITTEDGHLVSSSRGSSAALLHAKLPTSALQLLATRPGATVQFTDPEGVPVAGVLWPMSRFHWAALAEIPLAEAYRQVNRLRNATILVLGALLLGVGSIAYVLGLLIVRPLNRLSAGAAKVAAGDLSVDLPVVGGGEVTYLTEVFNDMVKRLREGREALDAINETLRVKNDELQRLSLTDGLTGLDNRRQLMQTLAAEVERSHRHGHSFAVVMLDVDHFKNYNDSHGHLAGDAVLTRVGALLRECTRGVDCSARYGGEEFVLVLPETGVDRAVEVAERIRARLAKEGFANGRITLSAGVAQFPKDGETPETVLSSADAALYRAKGEGRDRVVLADGPTQARPTDATPKSRRK
jgi:diguanylate cyclase (GGDEF)-like protein